MLNISPSALRKQNTVYENGFTSSNTDTFCDKSLHLAIGEVFCDKNMYLAIVGIVSVWLEMRQFPVSLNIRAYAKGFRKPF